VSTNQITPRILRRSTDPDEYRTYIAAHEWDLTDPIVIESRADFKSEARWHDRMEPYHHQVTNLITFCRRLPVTLLADDVGLGKTISAGLIISELISRSRVSKILVVCPKLLGPQWKEELSTKFDIESEVAIGSDLIHADPKNEGAIITTYASARLHLEKIPQDRFQMLVLDEAHKLRNLYGVEKAPQVATRFRKALEDRRFRFVLMLTATPIQNRLWDIYSLVDLLAAARGHPNPFGSDGAFARKFIADNKEQARQLKLAAKDQFRDITYGYMSRVRRGDAKLFFPDRVVQLHKVDPSAAELRLIETIAKPIQNLNRLVQISILQALTSSPEALMAQLKNMARNGTVPADLADAVSAIVLSMPSSAKLHGLGSLVERLKRENPERWRLVVFTSRLETQTTIQIFLEQLGLKVGIINGASGSRNQETIARFREMPPRHRVIVSTEAGSEGVNLQVANVLVNYDLPWNPMIVEQRIGRVQRLGTEHASVAIFNIILRNTFEEYIVGRLMEKLQMASHAIGDIESLLEASGISDDDDNGFDEKIRQLVIAALAGKDVTRATRQEEQSILEAKQELEREQKNIDNMLGSMDGSGYVGPRAPTLPAITRSMEPKELTLAAFRILGAHINQYSPELFEVEENSGKEYVRFTENAPASPRSMWYAPGTPYFQRLVSRVIATGLHNVSDIDSDPGKTAQEIAESWVSGFGAKPTKISIDDTIRCFDGEATLRVRATVAHDAYERLVKITCSPSLHRVHAGRSGLGKLPPTIDTPKTVGVDGEQLIEESCLDEAIGEFSRFYLERRKQEVLAAGTDERKRKKLEDDFTPRLEHELVGLEGKMHREIGVTVKYRFHSEMDYESSIRVSASTKEIIDPPDMDTCAETGQLVPSTCLQHCAISGGAVLYHLLTRSEISGRLALPSFVVRCSCSGKLVLTDEVERSAVTGNLVAKAILLTSQISGKRAEPEHFGVCEFTGVPALVSELSASEISNRRYRSDEELISAVSGKKGHKNEFSICYETRQPIAVGEAEQCAVTQRRVRPGILQTCEVSQQRVMPSELVRCAATGKRALRSYLVASSISGVVILEDHAVRATSGKFCAPVEAKTCQWNGEQYHPDDLRICHLTDLLIHFSFAVGTERQRLQPLAELLNGVNRSTDRQHLWEMVSNKVSSALGGSRCRVEAAVLSPSKQRLATCLEVRTLLGMRVHQVGAIFLLNEQAVVGRIPKGRRSNSRWVEFIDG